MQHADPKALPYQSDSQQAVGGLMHPPVTIVLGGACVRAIFSDAYGDRRLLLCEAQIALEGPGATIVSGSDRRLTTMGKAVTRIGDPP